MLRTFAFVVFASTAALMSSSGERRAQKSQSLTADGQSSEMPPAASWYEQRLATLHSKCLQHFREYGSDLEKLYKANSKRCVQMAFGDEDAFGARGDKDTMQEREMRAWRLAGTFKAMHVLPQDDADTFDFKKIREEATSPEHGWALCLQAVLDVLKVESIEELKLPTFSEAATVQRQDLSFLLDLPWYGRTSWKDRTAMRLRCDDVMFWLEIITSLFPKMGDFLCRNHFKPDRKPVLLPLDYYWTVPETTSEVLLERLQAYFYAARSSKELQMLTKNLNKHLTVVDGHLIAVRDLHSKRFTMKLIR